MEVDPKQLQIGIEVEKEHSGSITGDKKKKIRKIALDHLKEIPDYYTRLKRMEKEAGVEEARYMDALERMHDITAARIRKGAKEGKYWLLRSEADEERWEWALKQVVEDTMAASIGGYNKGFAAGGDFNHKKDRAWGARNKCAPEMLKNAVDGLTGKKGKKSVDLP